MRFLLLISVLLLQACASSGALHVARDQFRHGSTSEALRTLSEADIASRDRLLLYLDRGLVAQAAGQYVDSVIAFESAIKIIDELDYLSLRDQSAAVITSDRAIRYSGEYSERLWIHTFQMLNFLLLDNPEAAAVEARRAAALYSEYNDVLKQDVFTRSLMALSFLTAGQVNSARVEYRKLHDDFADLMDVASMTMPDKNASELIVVIATGFIPRKLPGDLFVDLNVRISFPYYAESYDNQPDIQVFSDATALEFTRVDTPLVAISKKALAERGKAIAARQAVRIAAKQSIVNSIERNDDLAGGIARLLLFVIEQADTRSWETLPAYLSLIRIPLTEGKHAIDLRVNDYGYVPVSISHNRTIEVDIKPGQRQIRLIRVGVEAE